MGEYSFLPPNSLGQTTSIKPRSTYGLDLRASVPSLNWGGGDSYAAVPNVNLTTNLQQNPNSLLSGPSIEGVSPDFDWTKFADSKGIGGLALNGLNTAANAYGTWMNVKNQKFMQDYYGKQQAMQKEDFANNARSANSNLSQNFLEGQNARGINASSEQGKKEYADYMGRWGAKETIG